MPQHVEKTIFRIKLNLYFTIVYLYLLKNMGSRRLYLLVLILENGLDLKPVLILRSLIYRKY